MTRERERERASERERETTTKNAPRCSENLAIAVTSAMVCAVAREWEIRDRDNQSQSQSQRKRNPEILTKGEHPFCCCSPIKFSNSSSSGSRHPFVCLVRDSTCSTPKFRSELEHLHDNAPSVILLSRNKQNPPQPQSFSRSSLSNNGGPHPPWI